jgi:hypothetical protein
VSVEQFLKQSAVDISVSGEYSLPNWYDSKGKRRSFLCRSTRVSPFRMMVEVPVIGKVGDRVTSYFRDLGNLEGQISDTKPGGILFELEMTADLREKFASKLTWLESKQKKAGADARKEARIALPNSHSILALADGSIHTCMVIDMSVDGAAISAQVQPPIGMPLAIGACIGRVVRHLPDGFAVKFVERQNRIDLNRLIIRAAPLKFANGETATARLTDENQSNVVAA